MMPDTKSPARLYMLNWLVWLVLLVPSAVWPLETDAQTVPSAGAPTPPAFERVDSNGINLLSGTFAYQQATVTIGTPGNGGLAHSYSILNGLWADDNTGYVSLQAGVYDVTIGHTTEQFTLSGGIFTDTHGVGSALTYNGVTQLYTYTSRDGVVSTFSAAKAPCFFQAGSAILSSTQPNGIVISYNYVQNGSCWTLASVTSSTGYMLTYSVSGVTTNIQAINNSVDYCSPTAVPCSGLTQSWPIATITAPTQTGSGSTTQIQWSVTDPMSRSTAYAGASQANGLNCTINQGQQPDFVFNMVETHAGGLVKTYTYGNFCNTNASRVVAVSYAGGGTTTYSYVPKGLNNPNLASTGVRGPNGQTGNIDWTVASTVGSIPNYDVGTYTDSYGKKTSYTYDSFGRVVSITHPEGNIDQYQYDGRGNVTTATRVPKPGSSLSNIVVTANYDATCTVPAKCNKPNYIVDARGNQTDYTYDTTNGTGLLLSVTEPAGAGGVRPQTRYSYSQVPTYAKNSSGVLVQVGSVWMIATISKCATGTAPSCIGTADETKTVFSYTGSNNAQPTSVTVEAGDGSLIRTEGSAYDSIGNVVTATGALNANQTTVYVYDADREQIGVIGPHPDVAGTLPNRATRTTYNGDGRPTLVERGTTTGQTPTNWAAFSPLTQVAMTYDKLDGVVSEQESGGGVTTSLTQYQYDQSHRLLCKAVRMNPSAFSSPPNACSLGSQGAYGPDRVTFTGYDLRDKVTSVTEAYGVPGAQRTAKALTYGDNGELLTEQDANGNLTSLAYDGFDRLAVTTYPAPAGGAATTESATYDANSNVVQVTRRDGQVVTTTFDALNKPTAVSNPSTTYSRDNDGRVVTAVRSGITLTYAYDALGRQTSEAGPGGTMSFAYDLDNTLTQITWPDSFAVTYSADLYDEVTSVQETSGSGGLTLASYTYNNMGQRNAATLGNGIGTTYGYDPVFRLSSVAHAFPTGQTANNVTISLSRNSASQILTRNSTNAAFDWAGGSAATTAYTSNALNQVTSAGASSFTYDARGNLTSDGTNVYGYDVEDHLTSFNSSATLVNDGLARLAVINDLSGGVPTNSSRGFRYAGSIARGGSALIAEYGVSASDSGTLYRRYVPGPGVDETIVWYDRGDNFARRWILSDERGSAIAVTSALGSLIAANTYDEYGVAGASNLGRFQYTGQIWISETGTYHYKARDYLATQGRFLQTDPVGYADDMNLYAYVAEDPLNRSDPMGLAGCGSDGGYKDRAPLSTAECTTWKDRQEQGKRDVATVRTAEAAWRKDPNSDQGKAFAKAMTDTFGKNGLSAGNLARLDKALNSLSTFYNDPGTAKGGRYDVYRAVGWSSGASIREGQVSFGTYFFNGPNDSYNRISTAHEPLHLFGFGDRSMRYPDNRYYPIATPYWDQWGAQHYPNATQDNADNWGCLIAHQCK